MKVQLVFLLACGVILSQQRRYSNEWQRYGDWPSQVPYITSPADRRYVIGDDMALDFKEYLLARSYLNWKKVNPFGGSSNIEIVHQPSKPAQEEEYNAGWNIESRAKNGFRPEEPEIFPAEPANPRFFLNIVSTLGSSSAYNNPLLKTIYYFTTATATTCVSTSCIPDSLFESGSSTIICRRKRTPQYIRPLEEGVHELSPSSITENVEPTALAQNERFARADVSASSDALLSSMEQIEEGEPVSFNADQARQKRFFYNYFYASTTITTYSFVTTTVTISLSNLASGSDLSCRPSSLSLCF